MAYGEFYFYCQAGKDLVGKSKLGTQQQEALHRDIQYELLMQN
jgi:hypothetical protein